MLKYKLALIVSLASVLAFGQPSDDAARKKLLDIAFKYKGVPYVYGSESPKAFDCSGFVRYVYREAFGLELPRSARAFYSAGSPVDWKLARPGDVFVYDTVGGAPSHVSIVVGDGTVIHAVSDGPRTGVIVSPLTDRYWAPRLIAARTFLATGSGSGSGATKPAAATKPADIQPAAVKPDAKPAAKPAEKPVASKPAAPERAIADIGLTIPAAKAETTDRIPTAAGTGVAFTLTNGTGKDGSFIVLFFRVDPKSYKLKQIHEEKVRLAAAAAFGLPPYTFDDPGKYKLVVKDSWGNPLLERVFTVTERID